MNENEFAELSAAAALDALTPEDAALFAATLAERPEWQWIVDQDRATSAALAATPVVPPPALRGALLAAIASTLQGGADDGAAAPAASAAVTPADVPPTAGASATPQPRRWTRAIFALAACLVIVAGLGIGITSLVSNLNRPASVVVLEQIQSASDAQEASIDVAGGGTATAHWSAELGSAVLVTDNIAQPAEGSTYELWFVRGDQAISAGVFDVKDGDATAQLSGTMAKGDVIAVTVETAGGSKTGQPTSSPVIVIPTA